jgi:hypothetical protein
LICSSLNNTNKISRESIEFSLLLLEGLLLFGFSELHNLVNKVGVMSDQFEGSGGQEVADDINDVSINLDNLGVFSDFVRRDLLFLSRSQVP